MYVAPDLQVPGSVALSSSRPINHPRPHGIYNNSLYIVSYPPTHILSVREMEVLPMSRGYKHQSTTQVAQG